MEFDNENNICVWEGGNEQVWHGGYAVWLTFDKGFVHFNSHFSCIYSYKTEVVDDDRLVFFWGFIKDCRVNLGHKNDFGLSSFPTVGEPFGEFILVSDTLLKVNYFYPEWVEKINNYINDDIIFPTTFRLIHEGRNAQQR